MRASCKSQTCEDKLAARKQHEDGGTNLTEEDGEEFFTPKDGGSSAEGASISHHDVKRFLRETTAHHGGDVN